MDSDKHIVAIVTFEVTKETFATVASQAAAILEHRLPTIPGFVEGTLLTNEGSTEIVSFTEWESRHTWAVAQWDEDVERVVAGLFQDTGSYALRFFFPLIKATARLTK